MFRIIFLLFISHFIAHADADPNEPDIYGTLPLSVAASKGDPEACRSLINQGARIDGSDNSGRTALHIAAYWGHFAVCKLLIAYNAAVDLIDGDGETPLHHAASTGSAEICELLRSHHADPTIESKYRGRAIDIARRSNEDDSHQEVIRCLLRNAVYERALPARQATRRSNDCGSFNATTCHALAGELHWELSPLAFKYFQTPEIPCQDKDGTLTCQWEQSGHVSHWIAIAPCIDFPKGISWTGSFDIEIDFTAPARPNELSEYPAFALNIHLVAGNMDKPIAQDRIDLSLLPHSNWHWQLSKHISLLGSSETLPKELRCVSLGIYGANRLRDSKLKGTIRVKNAKLGVLYGAPHHPSDGSNLPSDYVPLRTDLLVCPINNLPYSTGCILQEGLVPGSRSQYPKDTIIHIDYVHTCTGTPISIGILLGDGQKAEFVSDGSQNAIELTGNGPVMFKNFDNPSYTKQAVFRNPCTIRISGFHVRPGNELQVENEF